MALTLTFLQHAAENAAGAAAAGALTVLGSREFHLISDVPWYAVASAAAIAGLGSALKSVISLTVQNGTASLNPNVVAKATDTASAG